MKNIILLLILAVIMVSYINKQDYVEIPSTSIRLRVIAATNNEEDQKNKIIVKNAVVNKLNSILKDKNSYIDVDSVIKNNQEIIGDVVKTTLDENNLKYNYEVNYGLNYFPQKSYKGVTYNAGNYQSLVITLNEGKGENWWCALYPPLCQIDENLEENEYRFLIKDMLSQYN